MRVAFNTLNENPHTPSNAARFVRNLVIALARCAPDNEYVLYTSAEGARLFADVTSPSVSRRMLPHSNERRLRRILSEQSMIPACLEADGIDVLHCVCGVLPLRGHTASMLNICTMHHKLFPREIGLARSGFRSVMFDLSVRKACRVVANSSSNLADIVRYLPVREDKIVLIPEAVDPLYLEPVPAGESARALEELGVQRPYILFASALYRYKNLETLLDAFARLRRATSLPHHLVVAGHATPRYRQELMARCRSLALEKVTRFVGHQGPDHLRALYAEADLFVYPSLYETFGHPPLQAMGQGTPVIASDCSSIPEVVGDAALLFRPRSADELQKSIWRVLEDPSLRQELVERGRSRARQYDWDTTARGVLDAYAACA